MMRRIVLILIMVLLTACNNKEPVESLSLLAMPEDLQFYNGSEETVFDRVMLNLIQVWDRKAPKMDLAYYYLAKESNLQTAEALTVYFTERLSPSGWVLDKENSFTDVHIVFSRESRIGKQNLVLTRIPLAVGTEQSLYTNSVLMVSLSPVP